MPLSCSLQSPWEEPVILLLWGEERGRNGSLPEARGAVSQFSAEALKPFPDFS